jgi:hypothetical protein
MSLYAQGSTPRECNGNLLLAAVAARALTGAHANAAEITLIAPSGIRAALDAL